MKPPLNSVILRGLCAALMGTCLATLAPVVSAEPVTIGGVRLEDAVNVAGKPLVRNGAGIRYKAIFKVYTAGLYLEKTASTTDEVLSMPGPKRMTITMLRDIDSKELEFFHALMRIWLGPNPPDWKPKEALLGKA